MKKKSSFIIFKCILIIAIVLTCVACSKKKEDKTIYSVQTTKEEQPGEEVQPTIEPQPSKEIQPSSILPTDDIKPTIPVEQDLNTSEKEEVIVFHDQELEAMLRDVLEQPTGEITQKSLDEIDELCIMNGKLVKDISTDFWANKDRVLEYYFNDLNGTSYEVKDWSDLRYLTNLKRLVLMDCNITDITFLRDLKQLEILSIAGNSIDEYTVLSKLTSLKQLYLGLSYYTYELGFLRKLNLEESDIFWDSCFYPYILTKQDIIIGITSGNLINSGCVTYDGTNIYFTITGWGDLPHTSLIQYNVKKNALEWMDSSISEQMADAWNCEVGNLINEEIECLNFYKGNLYYVSKGSNSQTADIVGDGEYYIGDPLCGIIKVNITSGKRQLLSAEQFYSMCVVNDHIYAINSNHEFIQMSLDGSSQEKVTKDKCDFIYVNEEAAYYLTTGKNKKLIQMKHGESEGKVLFKGDINSPLILKDEVFYEDSNGYLYRYDLLTGESKCIYSKELIAYNVDENYVYVSSERQLLRMDYEGEQIQEIYNMAPWKIQIIGDYLFLGNSRNLCKIRKDGTEFNDFVEYY